MSGGSDDAAKRLIVYINDMMAKGIPQRRALITEISLDAFRALRDMEPNPDWDDPETLEFLADQADMIMERKGIWAGPV